MKKCTKCGVSKDESEYFNRSDCPTLKRSECKECHNTKTRTWKRENSEKMKAIRKKWADANQERVKNNKKEYSKTEKAQAYRKNMLKNTGLNTRIK